MSDDAEQKAARNARRLQAISQVRGQAQTAGGAVAVETDVNGTITQLRISHAAMSVAPDRLAQAIAQCHETARQRAQAEGTRLYTELLDAPETALRKSTPNRQDVPNSPEWEELTPLRITRSV
ncbi:YbaB/EbfC family nucleoid-associated protein [Nocardia otitidiscaviarum]|uniref:YbaB/EbfC family nucleoid-associated protein n=1 Tax=Nocardia otitidiscaviarum TaxID=1823 RepID=UPI0011DCCC53|nr:YbaB/EbfC family nucleoid-associated protein [Nocardia otitidiscaviarum]MBF6138376.1 YbaB/EbfC family nucleoid-associated protein [Nocardia otitidiscaviarum]MBF6483528.1 YbaB/EbfC family nucleoid-associated protein [Nocardia otitidiscaviarum]